MSEEKSADKITIKEVDDLCKKMAEKEIEIEKAAAVVTALNKEYMQLEGQVVQYLKDLGRDKYDSPYGKCSITEKWRVNLPKDDEAKRALFEHLREREIFDQYATVNSNSLNSLYMADWKAAQAEGRGMEFSMPGIEAPKLFEALKFKAVRSDS